MASSCTGGGLSHLACEVIPYIPIVGGELEDGSKLAGTTATAVTGDVVGDVAKAMASAATGLLKTLSTFWMSVSTPDLTSASSPVAALMSKTSWITGVIAVVCVLVAAARMALRRRGEPVHTLMLGLARLVVVSFAGTSLIETAGKLGDLFSADLLHSAGVGSGGWSGVISVTVISGTFASGDGMLLIVALLIVISSLIQLLLMVLRVGLLVILTGTLPLAAAASMSDWGESWWRKHLAWLTAWLLYKPAAAILYAGAFYLTQGTRSVEEVTAGFMILILSVLLLPALLKTIVPMTSALGAASGGGLAMAATGALATGAIKALSGAATGGASAAADGAAATAKATAKPTGSQVTAGEKDPDGAQAGAAGTAPSPAGASEGRTGRGSRPADPPPPAEAEAGSTGGNGRDGQPAADSNGKPPSGSGTSARTGKRPAEQEPDQEQDNTGGPTGAAGNGDDDSQEIGG